MAYTYQEAKRKIKFHVRRHGHYWNNIVSSILKQATHELGKDEANRLIRECHLTDYGWEEED